LRENKKSRLHNTTLPTKINNNDIKILIAEDDTLMRKILKLILQKEGYQVISAKDGSTAIEKILLFNPDLVITDIILPFRSGLEIISLTKENFKNIPIIVVSVLGEEKETVIEAFTLGADDFISKPFNANELLIRVKRLLDNIKFNLKETELEIG
jgi:two-component system response regulator VicR